ncbi:hypothetical protein [Serratia entomophila]|jgi:hypothetical protein|uniref:Uncharacterized protein n=1 Tax=Serratia entomophila TaxID=42906 RepID=A0ABY5CM20_9GAMM|nr:hypothetical protein [Serratia entomophila]USU99033.1 hypothetical protein KFQ06_13250 [Serratia entomophila]
MHYIPPLAHQEEQATILVVGAGFETPMAVHIFIFRQAQRLIVSAVEIKTMLIVIG